MSEIEHKMGREEVSVKEKGTDWEVEEIPSGPSFFDIKSTLGINSPRFFLNNSCCVIFRVDFGKFAFSDVQETNFMLFSCCLFEKSSVPASMSNKLMLPSSYPHAMAFPFFFVQFFFFQFFKDWFFTVR